MKTVVVKNQLRSMFFLAVLSIKVLMAYSTINLCSESQKSSIRGKGTRGPKFCALFQNHENSVLKNNI